MTSHSEWCSWFIILKCRNSPWDQNDDSQRIFGDGENKHGEGWTKRDEGTAKKHRHAHSEQTTLSTNHEHHDTANSTTQHHWLNTNIYFITRRHLTEAFILTNTQRSDSPVDIKTAWFFSKLLFSFSFPQKTSTRTQHFRGLLFASSFSFALPGFRALRHAPLLPDLTVFIKLNNKTTPYFNVKTCHIS